jgi:hypothetical protein
MSEDPLDPLDPRLRDAISIARGVPRVEDDLRARLRARIASAVAPPVAPGSPSSPDPASAAGGSVLTGKLAIALLAGAVAGGAGGVWIGRTTAPPTVVRVEVPIAPSTPSTPIEADVEAELEPLPPPSPIDPVLGTTPPDREGATERSTSTEPTTPRRSVTAALADLEAEQTLIDAARAALARGNAEQATELLSRHRARFPGGALREEREGLEVLALVRVDREEAERSAERFVRRYPDSVLVPAIERALGR